MRVRELRAGFEGLRIVDCAWVVRKLETFLFIPGVFWGKGNKCLGFFIDLLIVRDGMAVYNDV